MKSQEQGYKLAYRLACEQLASMDIEQQCHKSGAKYVNSNKIIINHLNRSYFITLPKTVHPGVILREHSDRRILETLRFAQGDTRGAEHSPLPDVEISYVYFRSSGSLDPEPREKVPLKDKILILHYLTLAKGIPITNRLITFKQLPGCASYFPVFHQVAIKPLLDYFGKEPELLVDAAAKLGGCKANHGDVSVIINAFPRVPITFILWRGDEEFAPRGSIMFDSTISDYLPAEDIRELCGTIARRLVSFGKHQ